MKIYNFWLTAFGESGARFLRRLLGLRGWVVEPGEGGVVGRGAIQAKANRYVLGCCSRESNALCGVCQV